MTPFMQLPETRYMPQALVPTIAEQKTKPPTAKSSVTCAFCEYAVHELLGILKENRTEEAIKDALDQLCSYLPSTLTQECKEYVEDYSELIISLLEQEVDPSTICSQLGLCSTTNVPFVSMMPSLKIKVPMSKPHLTLDGTSPVGLTECELCNRIVYLIDSILEDKPTEQQIIHAVENVCPLMPKSYYSKCISLLETYGTSVIHYLATLGNGKLVCQAVDICPRPRGQVHLLGGDKCTFGPSYWCRSVAHARACKAEQHCLEKVWIQ
jgi:saposin